ncbi:hypothetical protein THASP1DRAFT_30429 [Thamnocephalis sphaerospora]|uniref:Uncharacterized protein n=1 Tax=Thamnocephalis sphaerospora TaxID=78915 RepID=A0A4P9XP61_9FUNG|nr:hypothetical protein THASP1DRAFT_30429 [Thamnocephalis sphaerospora]|eukprot:RKP07758.1 hypothetical protein THASP1DRAFT_30429 [Thamnocephalis sphaerospora]
MGFVKELRSGQYTIYAQWCALISVPLLILFGILNLTSTPIYSILGFVFAFLITFSEMPLLLKCCPTSERFDTFMKRFENNYFRAGMYAM